MPSKVDEFALANFAETDESVNRKGKTALKHGLVPILCVGESVEERESGKTKHVVREQIVRALDGFGSEEVKRLIVAYEPVWAIGTGRTATPAQAQEMHAFIRRVLVDRHSQELADSTRILYGGSVKPDNARDILAVPEVGGALVGGASLKAADFLGIIRAA